MLINNTLSKKIMNIPQLTCNDKIVYLALITFSDKKNVCFPSHKTIAGFCSRSVSTVKRALNRLQCLGYVKWQHCFDSQNARLRNRYTITDPDAVAQSTKEPVSSITIKRFELPDYRQQIIDGYRGFIRTASALFDERRPYKQRRVAT